MYDTYDPNLMKRLFNKEGEIYSFLKENVDTLMKNHGEEMVNAGGLIV